MSPMRSVYIVDQIPDDGKPIIVGVFTDLKAAKSCMHKYCFPGVATGMQEMLLDSVSTAAISRNSSAAPDFYPVAEQQQEPIRLRLVHLNGSEVICDQDGRPLANVVSFIYESASVEMKVVQAPPTLTIKVIRPDGVRWDSELGQRTANL